MFTFDLHAEAEFDPQRHIEKILETVEDGDVTVACWEPGQISPNHCHPFATEIYLCIYGGGLMRTPSGDRAVEPGKFVVHPPGEVHEYVNGSERTLLFRVRYGPDRSSRHFHNRGKPGWVQKERDVEYFAANPVPTGYAKIPSST
jgi:quercetin dioxygenase-like cupin family protein